MIHSTLVSRALHIGGALCVGLLAGCERSLEPAICPAIGVGDLAISEVRGPSSGIGNQGHWIELYNATAAPIDLRGLQLLLRKLDGSDEARIVVRDTVTVDGGAYVVLGYFPDDASRPAHVDYGWYPDFIGSDGNPHDLFDSGALDVLACDLRIDRIVFDDLPSTGTYSFGTTPPDAAANDTATAWCNDVTDDADASTDGLPGTPGAANHPCVPP